ncbi:hypothetical protein JCM33374_g312 [Metschnikowia sp. JCM 33374]|nr:hypothetical protein JCM33374_g312 [Metschnikowia sp. JCM 33374]
MAEEKRVFPDSTNKWPTPFANLFSSHAYPKWEPVDTAKQTKQVFKFGFYTTAGAYAWLFLWKRTTFKLELPMVVTGFATVAVAARGISANLREKNDGWNTFWAVAAGNATVLTAGFRQMPLKQKVMGGVSGACLTALAEQIMWAQSASSAGPKHEVCCGKHRRRVAQARISGCLAEKTFVADRGCLGCWQRYLQAIRSARCHFPAYISQHM